MDTKLLYIGKNGNVLDLFNNEYFILTHADGLTDVSSNVSTSTTPYMDGDTVNNVRSVPRGIVLDLRIKQGVVVEEAKRFILQTIKPKQSGKLQLTQIDRMTEIAGVVENVTMPRFTDTAIMQVTLYCSEPYWSDVSFMEVELARVLDLHCFPIDTNGLAFPLEGVPFGEFEINNTRTYTNDGDADCGMIITIVANAEAINPTLYKSDGSYIGINDTLVTGDKVIINTNRGNKTITKNGISIFDKIKKGSTFLQMETGDNEFTIDSDGGTEGNLYFTLSFKRRFV